MSKLSWLFELSMYFVCILISFFFPPDGVDRGRAQGTAVLPQDPAGDLRAGGEHERVRVPPLQRLHQHFLHWGRRSAGNRKINRVPGTGAD